MTFSGSRGGGTSPAQFIARLARETGLSQRAIIREARQAGFRFGNDLARGLISAARGRDFTGRQGQALQRFGVRLTVSGDARSIGEAVGTEAANAIQRLLQETMLRVSYRVSAEVGFIWESGSLDKQETNVSTTREVTISLSQVDSFNANITEFATTHRGALIDIASNELGFDSQYGEFIFTAAPQIQIVSTSVVN